MALIKCSECGSEISEKAQVCPKCGCPVDVSKEIIATNKKKKIKKISIFVSVLLIIAILIVTVVKIMNRPNTDGYFSETRWGMTMEQVKKILGEDATINEDKDAVLYNYEDYEGKSGIDAMISCDCADDSLKKVTVFLTNGDDSSYTDSKLIDECTEDFNKLYGEAEKDSITTFWNTPKSKIELSYLMDGFIIITYEDITKVEK